MVPCLPLSCGRVDVVSMRCFREPSLPEGTLKLLLLTLLPPLLVPFRRSSEELLPIKRGPADFGSFSFME